MKEWWPRVAWLALILVVGGPAVALTISSAAFADVPLAQPFGICGLLLLPIGIGLGIASLVLGRLDDPTVARWAVGLGIGIIVLGGPIVLMVLVGDVHGA
jgi:hypothetical protein